MASRRRARVLLLLLLCCLLALLSYPRLIVHVHVLSDHVGLEMLRDVEAPSGNVVPRLRDLYEAGFRRATPELCPDTGRHVALLILVASEPRHLDHRMAVRHTWGQFHGRRHVVVGFMLGSHGHDPELARAVAEEADEHGDVIVNNNREGYANLTLKTAAMFEWTRTYCPHVGHLLKTDDDTFLNVPRLLDFVRALPPDGDSGRSVYGRLRRDVRPERYARSKYFMPARTYRPHVYPAFTTGGAYLTTPEVAHDLLETGLDLAYLSLEDVFFTGVVAQRAGVTRVSAPEITNLPYYYMRNACLVHKAISFHVGPVEDLYRLWGYLLDRRRWCV